MKYGKMTIKQLIGILQGIVADKDNNITENSLVMTGDFEGNYTHLLHEVMLDEQGVFIGYEMHENMGV